MDIPSQNTTLKILVLEPYYGGSHKSFLKGLKQLPFEFEFMTFPARKWKWRMRLAAPYFAEKLFETGRHFDRILCSTFVDVAAFRGLAPGWVREVPLLTYFHENQFAYPVQSEDERDFHFALTNVTTALASDRLAFNSSYNLNSFLQGIKDLLKKSYDLKLENASETIHAKSRVLPPGIDFSFIDAGDEPKRDGPPVILWNHRWEHDKNPELFFSTLFELDREGVDFRLVVLGKSYSREPVIFEEVRGELSHKLLHFGYAESPEDYAHWLKRGDIAVSTARHEFFGIAMIEAVRAGCRPLVPKSLSYPELFPEEFLYDEDRFIQRLREEVLRGKRLPPDRARSFTDGFSWDTLHPVYSSWLQDARIAGRGGDVDYK
jgi:glycosyltransferase involved in cell wall biosynthesis